MLSKGTNLIPRYRTCLIQKMANLRNFPDFDGALLTCGQRDTLGQYLSPRMHPTPRPDYPVQGGFKPHLWITRYRAGFD